MVHITHNVFEENTYKYILTGIGAASIYKVAKPLRTKNSSKVAFVLGVIYKKGGAFKYPKVFQCDNGPEFKGEAAKLLEKHNVDIRKTTAKHKYTHTAFVEAFNKELEKLLFKLMDAQELQEPKKVSTIWIRNVDSAVHRMDNTHRP